MKQSRANPPSDSRGSFFRFFAPESQEDPYPMYERARRDAPVFYSDELGMWVITRYSDICAVVRDTRRFSSRAALQTITELPPRVLEIMRRGIERKPTLINTDPPDHTALRKLCNLAFTPKAVASMEGRVRAFANELVDAFVADGQADLVARFTYPLPKLVISGIVGVPPTHIETFGRLADETALYLFSAGLPAERFEQAAEGFVALQHYIADMIRLRERDPQDDLLSAVVRASAEREELRLDLEQMVALFLGFLVAGHKTTTDMLGNALALLLDHPEQLRALVEDPGLAPSAVEEVIRRDAPVPSMHRVTTEEVEVAGVTIPMGERVLLLYGSANHDEALFQDPMRFDIHRPNASAHLGFGHGVHYCIGAPLARLEGMVGLQVLTQRLRALRYAGSERPRFTQVTAFRGPVSLNLAWDVE